MVEAQKPDLDSLLALLRAFSQAFSQDAVPDLDSARFDRAYNASLHAVCNHPCFTYFLRGEQLKPAEPSKRRLQLVLNHHCKYIGCHKPTCTLCKNNQEKRCMLGDNIDEYYIVNKAIKSKCGADVLVELVDAETKEPVKNLSVQLQISLTDGDRIEHPGQLEDLADIEIFVNKDSNNQPLLLTSNPVRRDSSGRLLVTVQDGAAALPEISVSFVTEKLRSESRNIKSFRLLVCATPAHRDLLIEPALSCKFKVITQRAWNDRKATYPHVDDSVCRLDFIGKEAVRKLQNLEQEVSAFGFTLPSVSCIQTVGQLKKLKEYMQQDHSLQATVIKMLNLNHERWNNICHVLDERTVVSDNLPRAFFPASRDRLDKAEGLFYKSRQAKVDLKNPDGIIERVPSDDGQEAYVVTLFTSHNMPMFSKKVDAWRNLAIASWAQSGHPGWCMAPEHGLSNGNGRGSSMPTATWGAVVSQSAPGILRPSSFELAGCPSPKAHFSDISGPTRYSPKPTFQHSPRGQSKPNPFERAIAAFEVNPRVPNSPTSASMHDVDDDHETFGNSVNFTGNPYVPNGVPLSLDNGHPPHYYAQYRRSSSAGNHSVPSSLHDGRTESAPEAIPPRERVVITTSNAPQQRLTSREGTQSATSTSNGNDLRHGPTFKTLQPANNLYNPSKQSSPSLHQPIHVTQPLQAPMYTRPGQTPNSPCSSSPYLAHQPASSPRTQSPQTSMYSQPTTMAMPHGPSSQLFSSLAVIQTSYPMPTAFGTPEMEDVLIGIASFVPSRSNSRNKSQQPDDMDPNAPQRERERSHIAEGTEHAERNKNARCGLDTVAPDTRSDLVTPTLLETPSFDFPTVISETLMGLRPILDNSLDAPLESMPSMGMSIPAAVPSQAQQVSQLMQLTTESSGMAWDVMVQDGHIMGRQIGSATEQYQLQLQQQLQQQLQLQQQAAHWG